MTDLQPNEIECTRCGAAVPYDLTVCPACGLNFYESDPHDDWQAEWTVPHEDGPGLTVGGISVAGVLLGVISGAGVMFVLQVWSNALDPGFWGAAALLIFSGIAAGAVGGGVAAFIAADRHLGVAIVTALFLLGLEIFFEAFWRDLALQALLTPRVLLTWGAILVAAGLAGIWQRNRDLRVDPLLWGNEDDLYMALLTKIGYDRDVAERLIAFERERAPQAPRAVLIRSAIRRWERDNQIS